MRNWSKSTRMLPSKTSNFTQLRINILNTLHPGTSMFNPQTRSTRNLAENLLKGYNESSDSLSLPLHEA